MPYQRPVLSLEDARKAMAGMLEEALKTLIDRSRLPSATNRVNWLRLPEWTNARPCR
jgi:hypothetical protein